MNSIWCSYNIIIQHFSCICRNMQEKVAENCVLPIFLLRKGALLIQKLTTIELDHRLITTKWYTKFLLNTFLYVKLCRRKVRKLCILKTSTFKKRYNSYRNCRSLCNRSFWWCFYVVTIFFWFFCGCMGVCHRTESDLFLSVLKFITIKSHTKFQINMSKYVREKCRKLYFQKVKKGHNSHKNDDTRTWFDVYKKRVVYQNFSVIR